MSEKRHRASKVELSLEYALELINRDLKTERTLMKGKEPKCKPLEPKTADKITQYAKTLNAIVLEGARRKSVLKKEYSKMSNEQLIKLLNGDDTPEEPKNDPV